MPELPPFCSGAVGYAGYDTVRYFERLPNAPPDDRQVPDLLVGLADPQQRSAALSRHAVDRGSLALAAGAAMVILAVGLVVPLPFTATVNVYCVGEVSVKYAVTDLSPPIVTWQAPEPVHAPPGLYTY